MYTNDKIIQHKNIACIADAILYCYRIRPINSLFANATQLTELIETMRAVLRKVNMPGTIYIFGEEQDPIKILNYYKQNYQKNGFPELKELFEEVLTDTTNQLLEKINYNYNIFLVFEDGKTKMRSRTKNFFKFKQGLKFTSYARRLYEKIEHAIYDDLRRTASLDIEKIDTQEKMEKLFNRIAFPAPVETIDSYFVEPKPDHLRYEYQTQEGETGVSLVKNFILESNENIEVSDSYANLALNQLQLNTIPTDVIIKFELEHSSKFSKRLAQKQVKYERANKRYTFLTQKKDKDYELVDKLLKISKDLDMKDDEYIYLYQMQFRIALHHDDIKELNARYLSAKKHFERFRMNVNHYIGNQDKLSQNLMPYHQSVFQFLQSGDAIQFTNFNFLGGFFIGDEKEGIIVSNELYSQKPILYKLEDILQGKTKTFSPTIAVIGTTGSGKSQLQNQESFLAMTVMGMPVLTIDPKGDRKKIVEKLGDKIATHLEIGGKGSAPGMFDPYLTSDTISKGLEKAHNLIAELERAVNEEKEIDLLKINKAHDSMIAKIEQGVLKRATFTNLVEELYILDAELIKNTKALKRHSLMKLFFGEDTTEISQVFKFDKPYNLVTFLEMKEFKQEKRQRLETKLFHILIKEVKTIILQFEKLYEGRQKYLAIDEMKLYLNIPDAADDIEMIVKTARSHFLHVRLLGQQVKDIPPGIFSQVESCFVGGVRDEEDKAILTKHFALEGNDIVLSYFHDNTKEEGVQEDKKYVFLTIDYNNRKCVSKVKFLDTFTEILDTRLKDDEIQTIT